jgi:transcriptional regulator GlxA family with amidase domain
VASVFTGALLLARAGLLDLRQATTHRRWRDALADRFQAVRLAEGRVVGLTFGLEIACH